MCMNISYLTIALMVDSEKQRTLYNFTTSVNFYEEMKRKMNKKKIILITNVYK